MILPTISKLGLPLRRKIAISAILSLGIFEMAASMIRLQLSLHKDFNPSGGNQAANTLAFFCTTVLECDTAIICASVPMVRPIMSKIWPSMFPEPRHSAGSFNLTVVSFHGYPWQDQPASPRNRHSSSNNNNISSPKMADTRRSSANKTKGPSNTLSPEDALKITASASGAPYRNPRLQQGLKTVHAPHPNAPESQELHELAPAAPRARPDGTRHQTYTEHTQRGQPRGAD
ncbi:hypothetical protein PG987_009184 [Apiospora arundinis]